MLAFRGVIKRYEQRIALERMDLTIPAGQTTILLGPSGCGKSTLLRLLVGLIWPDEGRVEIAGTRLTPDNADSLRHRIGYVIQEGGLFPHLTARKNLALLPSVLGWSPARIRERISELVELTRFPLDALERYPSKLSGGQRQRVSLMRALMLDPAILLLDEPLGALDPMIRRELQEDLKEVFSRLHKTVLLVTHDLAEAAYFGDLIILLRDGRIIQKGRLFDLVHHPEDPFVTRFVHAQLPPVEVLR